MNRILKFAALGEGLTGLGLVVSPSLVIGLVFGATVEGAGTIACRLAGLGLACWPGPSGKPAQLGMLVYSLAAAIYLAGIGLGIGGDAKGIMLWPAVIAHAILTALLMRTFISNKKPG